MRIHLNIAAIVIVMLSVVAGAHAQDFSGNYFAFPTGGFGGLPAPTQLSSTPNAATDYVSLVRYANGTSSGFNYLSLSSFASSAQLAAISAQTTTQMSIFASQVADFEKRSAELSSLAASFNVMPPNQGDRFSLTFSGAGADSTGALSVSGAARIADRAMMFAGVARGPTQTMAKGGVSLSFH